MRTEFLQKTTLLLLILTPTLTSTDDNKQLNPLLKERQLQVKCLEGCGACLLTTPNICAFCSDGYKMKADKSCERDVNQELAHTLAVLLVMSLCISAVLITVFCCSFGPECLFKNNNKKAKIVYEERTRDPYLSSYNTARRRSRGRYAYEMSNLSSPGSLSPYPVVGSVDVSGEHFKSSVYPTEQMEIYEEEYSGTVSDYRDY